MVLRSIGIDGRSLAGREWAGVSESCSLVPVVLGTIEELVRNTTLEHDREI